MTCLFLAGFLLPSAGLFFSILYFRKLRRIKRIGKPVSGEIIGSSWAGGSGLRMIHLKVRYEDEGSLHTTTCTLIKGQHNASLQQGDRVEFLVDSRRPGVLYSTKMSDNANYSHAVMAACVSVGFMVLLWPFLLITIFM